MIEPFDHGAVSALRREGADMGLDQHGFFPGPSAPIPRAPRIGAVIDHLARARNILRLKRRGRIGHVGGIVNPESVMRAGLDAGDLGAEPAVVFAPHRPGAVKHDIDTLRRRSPEPENCAARRQPRPELSAAHVAPSKARTERGGALVSAPDAKLVGICSPSTGLSTSCQFLYSGDLGSLYAIASRAAFTPMNIGA